MPRNRWLSDEIFVYDTDVQNHTKNIHPKVLTHKMPVHETECKQLKEANATLLHQYTELIKEHKEYSRINTIRESYNKLFPNDQIRERDDVLSRLIKKLESYKGLYAENNALKSERETDKTTIEHLSYLLHAHMNVSRETRHSELFHAQPKPQGKDHLSIHTETQPKTLYSQVLRGSA